MSEYRYQKTPEELLEAQERQIRHLRKSNRIYDEGEVEEAERIAAALYVLFADYSSNKALTRVTKIRKELRFPESSSRENEGKTGAYCLGPYLCLIGSDGEYKPSLDGNATGPRVPFQQWWEGPVYRNPLGLYLKRKNLVFSLGNQDGGRHVDQALRDNAYHWLREVGDVCAYMHEGALTVYVDPRVAKTAEGIRWRGWGDGQTELKLALKWPPPEGAKALRNAHWATMRQMGWEADQAFLALGL